MYSTFLLLFPLFLVTIGAIVVLPFGRVSSWLALLVDLSHGIAVLVTGLATTDLRLELILPGHLAVVAWRPGSLIVSAA